MRAICFERKFVGDNGYAHPIHGVMTYVDLDAEAGDPSGRSRCGAHPPGAR